MASSPIADLSYRNYDGPLDPPQYRWWAIARVSIQGAFKKKSFWLLTTLSGFWYLILMIVFYFVDSFAGGGLGGGSAGIDPSKASAAMFKRVDWNELFLHAFSRAQLWYFIIALLIGVGTIANDNRANALLVYLSKPCTKLDYIIGKWVGIFIPMLVASAIPPLFFYGYCFMSYRENGFLNDPWLILRLLLLIPIPAIFHASVSLGISSMFKQGRVAGATYAGLFFFSYFLTVAMGGLHFQLATSGSSSSLVNSLFYCSVDGLQIGLAKDVLARSGGQPLPFMGPGSGMATGMAVVPAPSAVLVTLVLLLVCGVSLLIAWSRVRAVEVVG